jgi:rsbT co-antagonist protein RsbR
VHNIQISGETAVTSNNQTIVALQQENAQLHKRVAQLEQTLASYHQHADTTGQPLASQLAHNQEVLQLVIDSLPQAVFWKDRDLIYRGCNQTFATFAGVGTPAGIVGKSDYDLPWKPEEAESYRQYDQRVMDRGTPEYHIIETQQHADGKQSWADTNKIPLRDAEGDVIGILGTYEDITERKRMEEDLHLFKALADNALDGVAMASMDSRLTYANPAFQAMSGRGENLHGMSVTELYPPEVLAYIEQHVAPVLTTAGVWQGTLEIVRPDETRWLAQNSLFTIYNEEGQPIRTANIVRDITERKRQEAQLRRYAAIIEQTTDGVSTSDAQANVQMVNLAFRRMVGLSPDEDVTAYRIPDFHPDWALQYVQNEGIPVAISEGVWLGESALLNPTTGQETPISQVIIAHKTADGDLDFFSTIVRDLSDRKRQEAEREALQQQIIDAQREALRELSTPLIPITSTVMIMPLIGTIDSQRAQMVMEALLEGVAQHQAELVILDITGVSVVDTQVAQAFIQAAQAVRLLGAQVMLTGIGPQIAQTLVHLGVDLSGILTQGSLQSGIAAALRDDI